MARNLRGIVLEIGGNTTNLQKALKEVNSAAQTSATRIKEIDKALAREPGNTNLAKLRQEELVKQTDATVEKLRILKEADEKAKDQMNNGKISVNEYVKLQNELYDTEKELKDLKEQSNESLQSLKKFGENAQKVGKKMEDVGSAMSRSITPVVGALAIAGLKFAAEAEAMTSQFGQVFGDLTDDAQDSIDRLAEEVGMVPNRIKPAYVAMASFAKTTGMDTADALALTERATLAAADSAAFYDKSIEEATESLQSFLKGNYANDAALGISATETTRNTAANELYGKSFIQLSEDQKQLTLLAMVEDGNKLSGALGQAARESDTLANQLGNVQQAGKDALAKIAAPLIEPTVNILKDLGEVLGGVAEWFGSLEEGEQRAIIAMAGVAGAAGPVISTAGKIATGVGDITTKLAGMGGSVGPMIAKLAGPVGLIALSIGLGIALGTIIDPVTEAEKHMANYRKELTKTQENTEALVGETEGNERTAKRLTEQIRKLNAQEALSNVEKAKMAAMVKELNGLYPELGLEIDDATGKVDNMTDSIYDQIDAIVKSKMADIYTDEMVKIAQANQKTSELLDEEKVKYETRLEELGLTTEEEIDRWLKNQTELDQLAMGNTGIYIKSESDRVRAMRDNVRTLEGIQADGVAAYDKAADNYAKVLEQITGDQKESADTQIEQEQALTEAQREELKKREKYLKENSQEARLARQSELAENRQAFLNHLNDLETKSQTHQDKMTAIEKGGYEMSKTTADDWLKAMQTKNQEMLNWAENMRILAGKIPQEMYEELLAAGPAQSKVVADLAKKTPEQLQPWVNEWKKSGELARRVAMQELNTISGYSAGKNLALSLADGIKAYSSFPKREAVAMATGITAGTKLRFQIASPSKVFKRIGEQTAEGLAEGIKLGTSEAVYAANAMAKAVSQNAEMGMDVDWTNLSDPETLRATVGVDTASVASLKQAMASTTMDYERMGLAMRQAIKGLGLQVDGRALGYVTANQHKLANQAKGGNL